MLSMLIALAGFGCAELAVDVPFNERKEIVLTRSQQEMTVGANGFTFDLMRALGSKEDPYSNVFASPLSIRMCLAMAASGAADETRREMMETLGLKGNGVSELEDYFKTIIPALRTVDNTTAINIANSIWANRRFRILPDYISTLQSAYMAQSRNLAPDPVKAAQEINSWCSESTRGMIDHMIDKVDDRVALMLLNAIYFKGIWQTPFNSHDNVREEFTNADGSKSRDVTYMYRKEDRRLHVDEDAMALSLPYGNGAFRMVLVRPEKESASEMLSRMTYDRWNALLGNNASGEVHIWLPRFETEYSATDKLKSALEDMGMKTAFSAGADFSRMCMERLHISDIAHKARIKVDEKGTEAAAVTMIGMKLTSVAPQRKQSYCFKLDRPFIYAISEVSTGAILFMGVQNRL